MKSISSPRLEEEDEEEEAARRNFYAQLLGDAVLPETHGVRYRSEIARPLEDVFLLPTRLCWQLRYQQC